MIEISIFASIMKLKYAENRAEIKLSGYFMKSVNFKLRVPFRES